MIQRKQKLPDQFRSNTLPRFQVEPSIGSMSAELPELAKQKERKREIIKEMIKTDSAVGVDAAKLSPLKRIREGVRAELKLREKEMFTLDRSSLNTFALPGKPEPSTIMPHDNHKTKRSVVKKIRSSEVVESAASSTNKEFSFLPGVLGSSSDMEMNLATDSPHGDGRNVRPLSDLEEISEIMAKIHTGDDAINFFARFGSETPVSLSNFSVTRELIDSI